MTKLIVGLGNIDPEYHKTRHNIGFAVLDAYSTKKGLKWLEKPKFKAFCTDFTSSNQEKIIFAKPKTFYNLSGESVRQIKDFYKVENKDILVVHDEFALQLGKVRIRQSGSPAGNKGIKSISSHIGEDYWRIRIGILPDHAIKDLSSFVLGKLNTQEQEKITTNPRIVQTIDNFLINRIEAASFSVE